MRDRVAVARAAKRIARFSRETYRAAKRTSKCCEGAWLGGRDSCRERRAKRADRSLKTGRPVNRASLGSERGWLGGRDSNPDTVVQSHVSYRWTTSQCWCGARGAQELLII